MRKVLYSTMALTMGMMMLVSCNKDKKVSKEAVFTASIEQHIGQQGRTAINPENGDVKWLGGDKILVTNGNGETAEFTLQSGVGSTEGTFRTTGEFEMTEPFTAAYPQNATISGTTVTFNLPATQTITQTGTFANGANPMAAYATDENLAFKNLCGGLDIRLLGDNIHVSSIRITGSESEKLNGQFEADCLQNEPYLVAAQGNAGNNIVTLNCDVTLTSTTTAQEFFIILPVNALAQGFTMEVLDGETVIAEKQIETNLAQIARNEVKRFNPLLIVNETPTPIELPDVTTAQVTEITTTTATVGGAIIDAGNGTISESGICYKTGTDEWSCVAIAATNNAFSLTLTGLISNTTYTVRAYATNEEGTGYGEEVTFTTLEDVPAIPEGTINGLFTINANGDQVYFSQGNLQYNMTTNEWSFMEQQYDIVETNNQNVGYNYANQNIVSLFGWGTSGYDHGANAYQPWSTSTNYSDYYAYGAYTNKLYDGNGQADWGYNAISNGGNAENSGWRTLTRPEWNYVFNTRTTTSGIRWAKGKVNGVSGTILLPDNWTASVYALNNTNGGYYSSNTISASDWTNVLEANGAVFLPAAGGRDGTSVIAAGSNGAYWSASYFDSECAYNVFFYSGNLITNNGGNRRSGLSVRLVRNAE